MSNNYKSGLKATKGEISVYINISDEKLKEILLLKKHLKNVKRLRKGIKQLGEEEILNVVSEFVKKLPEYPEKPEKRESLIFCCRRYCSYEMNLVCFSHEILEEEKKTSKKLENISEEVKRLLGILKELDKITTTKKLDANKRKKLGNLIAQKTFVELKKEFEEISQITRMLCTTEISIEGGNRLFKLILSHLNTLSKYLK